MIKRYVGGCSVSLLLAGLFALFTGERVEANTGYYFEPMVYNHGPGSCTVNLNNNPGSGGQVTIGPGLYTWPQQHPNNSAGAYAIYAWTGCVDPTTGTNLSNLSPPLAGPVGPSVSLGSSFPDPDLGPIIAHVWTAQASNCVFTMNINNSSGYNRAYGIFNPSGFTGTLVFVYAGQTVPFSTTVSNCNYQGWYYQAVNGQNVSLGSGTTVSNVPGGVVYGNVGVPPGMTDQQFYQFGNQQSGIMPGSPVTNNIGGNSTNLQLGVGGMTNQITNTDNQQSYVPNYTNLSGAIVAGNQNVVNTMNQGINSENAYLSNLIAAVGRLPTNGGGGGTNIISITNLPDTNGLAELAAISNNTAGFLTASNLSAVLSSNAAAFSNQVFGYTNTGATAGSNWVTGATGWINTNVAVTGTGVDGFTFTITTPNPDIGPVDLSVSLAGTLAVVPAVGTWSVLLRDVMAFLVWVWLMFSLCELGESLFDEVLNQRQLNLPKADVNVFGWGGNAAGITIGVGYASLVAGVLASLPTAIVAAWPGFTGGMGNSVSSIVSALSTAAGSSVWTMCTYIVPWATSLTAFMTYCLYRWVIGKPLIWTVRGLILFMMA